MKLIELTQTDYRVIKEMALNEWRDQSLTYKNAEEFVCRCYVSAVASFCNARGLTLIDGKFYAKEPQCNK